MFEVFDNVVPWMHRQEIYKFVVNSKYEIKGWEDRDDLEISKFDLHSKWSLEDLENSGLKSYIQQVLNLSKHDFSFEDYKQTSVNLTRKGDYYYVHAHGEDTLIVLYYVNLQWKEEWGGETLFFDPHTHEAKYASSYKPGRFLVFDGHAPHVIKAQSTIGPDYRFTTTVVFKK
jgi:Rps23 Pro-64 3,4-dihydroxylase Tpa1-like proline 4-hydroxylase